MTQIIELKHPRGTVRITVDGPADLVEHVANSVRLQFKIQKAKERRGDVIDQLRSMAGMDL